MVVVFTLWPAFVFFALVLGANTTTHRRCSGAAYERLCWRGILMVLAYSMVWLVVLLLLTRVVFCFGRRIFVSSTSSCVCVCFHSGSKRPPRWQRPYSDTAWQCSCWRGCLMVLARRSVWPAFIFCFSSCQGVYLIHQLFFVCLCVCCCF